MMSVLILQKMRENRPWFSMSLMKSMYIYHMFFAGVYYAFAMASRSDSISYYYKAKYEYEYWMEIYATGTPFIEWVAFPFVNYLGFNYEMMMVLFAWLGFFGFVYFYIIFKENIKFKHKLFTNLHWGEKSLGVDLVALFIFLPNMHYWTSSLGKGSIIFLGLAMAFYGISNMAKRKGTLILGLLIVYHVRPHVFLFMAIGIIVGLFTGRQKVPFYQKAIVFGGSAIALILMYNTILSFVGLDSENLVQSFDKFSTTRSYELSKAGSGMDISNYPLILKLFTFWFRPLFVDAPGAIGLIVSFENMIYLILTAKLFRGGFFPFLRKSSALLKTGAVVFLATSFALSGTLSNMGIIVRQKSMVMYFFLFIILAFLDYKKEEEAAKEKRALQRRQEEELQLAKIANPV